MVLKFVEIENRKILSEANCHFIVGLTELIWNSLDANAKHIFIKTKKYADTFVEYIEVFDDGDGLDFSEVDKAFKKYGDSTKRYEHYNRMGRKYIGKDGKGRFTALSLSNNVIFKSIYKDKKDDKYKTFTIIINKEDPHKYRLSELEVLDKESNTGFTVIMDQVTSSQLKAEWENSFIKTELQKRLIPYSSNDKSFKIYLNDDLIDIEKQVKKIDIKEDIIEVNGVSIPLTIQLIHWDLNNQTFNRQVHYCSEEGSILKSKKYSLQPSKKLPKIPRVPFSIYLRSNYFEELFERNELNIEFNFISDEFIKKIEKYYRNYVLEEFLLPLYKKDKSYIIDRIKKDNLYPYPETPPKNETEKIQRKTFDYLVTKVDEVQKISNLKIDEQRYILTLLKLSLETQTDNLSQILIKVFKLSPKKIEEFSHLLNRTSLSNIIECSTEITKRLDIIQFIKNNTLQSINQSNYYGRKEMYKLLSSETWIFGEEYNFSFNNENKEIEQQLSNSIQKLSRETLIEKIKIDHFIERFLEILRRTDRDRHIYEIQKRLFSKSDNNFNLNEFSNNDTNRSFANNLLLILQDEFMKSLLYKAFLVNNNESLLFCILNNSKNKQFETFYKEFSILCKKVIDCTDDKEFEELKKVYVHVQYITELKNLIDHFKKDSFEALSLHNNDNKNYFKVFNFFLRKIQNCKSEKEFLEIKEVYCKINYLDELKELLCVFQSKYNFLKYSRFSDFSETLLNNVINDNRIKTQISEILSFDDENKLIKHIPNACVIRNVLRNNGSYSDNVVIEVLKPKKEIDELVYGNFNSFAQSLDYSNVDIKMKTTFILIGDSIDNKLSYRFNDEGKIVDLKDNYSIVVLTWNILMKEVSNRMELLERKLSEDVSKEKEFDILNKIYSEHFTT